MINKQKKLKDFLKIETKYLIIQIQMLKWSQFIIKDDKLFLKKLNLEVIPDDERESKMKELYENNVTGVSRGVGAGA